MKKILSLVLLLAFGSTLFASGGVTVNSRIEKSLHNSFAGAKHVTWQLVKGEKIHQATFIYNEQRLNAFFDEDGTLLATGRAITVSALPFLVNRKVSEKYSNYEIREITEYVKGDETSYLISMENQHVRLVVDASITGATSVFKKEKKNP